MAAPDCGVTLRWAWNEVSSQWISWARAPGHDSYWQFHRDAFLSLVPAASGVTLDIGCGEGRLSRDLTALGHTVVGLDASFSLASAAAHHPDLATQALVADAAALPMRPSVIDAAVAFMSPQDIDEFETAIAEAARVLRPRGRLVLALVHPLNSAGKFTDVDGRTRFVISDSYFERRRLADDVNRDGLAMTFHSEHRPLQAYTDAIADAGLLIERVVEVREPDPSDKWHRVPLFLHLRAVKPSSTEGQASFHDDL